MEVCGLGEVWAVGGAVALVARWRVDGARCAICIGCGDILAGRQFSRQILCHGEQRVVVDTIVS